MNQDEQILDDHRLAAKAGNEALQAGNRDQAGERYYDALEILDGLVSDAARRKALGPFALHMERLQFLDIARIAVTDAIELDKKLADDDALSQDLLTLGSIEGNTGDINKARALYEQSIEMCLKLGRLQNAASGTTNLALIVGQNDIGQAIEMLRTSLGYLDKQPFPATEIVTRLALLQALVVDEEPADVVAEVMNPLYAKFRDELRDDQIHNSVQPMVQALQALLIVKPQTNLEEWLAGHLPAAGDLVRDALDAAD